MSSALSKQRADNEPSMFSSCLTCYAMKKISRSTNTYFTVHLTHYMAHEWWQQKKLPTKHMTADNPTLDATLLYHVIIQLSNANLLIVITFSWA